MFTYGGRKTDILTNIKIGVISSYHDGKSIIISELNAEHHIIFVYFNIIEF